MAKLKDLDEFTDLVQRTPGDITQDDWRPARFYLKDPKNVHAVLDAVDAGLEMPASNLQKIAGFDLLQYKAYHRYKTDAVFEDDARFTSTRFLLSTLNYVWYDDSGQVRDGFELVHAQLLRMLTAARISPDLGYLYAYRRHANWETKVEGLALLNVFYPQHLFLSDMRPDDISPGKMAEVDAATKTLEASAVRCWLRGLISDDEWQATAGLSSQFICELYPHVLTDGYRAYHARVNAAVKPV